LHVFAAFLLRALHLVKKANIATNEIQTKKSTFASLAVGMVGYFSQKNLIFHTSTFLSSLLCNVNRKTCAVMMFT
jgi:hypothetical protein